MLTKTSNGFQVNKKIILFLNGEPPIHFPDTRIYEKIYCTDGSYDYLINHGIQPDVVTGDFDSIQSKNFSENVRIIHTPDQYFTDFEKIMRVIVDDGYKTVDIYGASGRQQDHYIGNLNAAYKFKEHLNITFFDNYSVYYFLDKINKISNVRGKTISLLPFPNANGINTKGLLYPLENGALNLLGTIGTRNKAIESDIEITFENGELIIFIIN